MVLRHETVSAGDPEVAWSLIAQPSRWKAWAPHLRGASGLGEPAVEGSALGVAWAFGVAPIPARIELVERSAERSHWVWKVGVVRFDHEVRPAADGSGGCTVAITCQAPRAIERAIAVSYWPIVGLLVDRLARAAERETLPPGD